MRVRRRDTLAAGRQRRRRREVSRHARGDQPPQGQEGLFSYAKEWSQIDLKPFNNSEITTLEEHIKRRWADISAETAGEQYTPDDVIDLISELIIARVARTGAMLAVY